MDIIINNIKWKILFVESNNINLINNHGEYTLGMTDNNIKCIFIDDTISGELLYNVLCHELCHAYCFSYNIYMDINDEEHLAQFISDYGKSIINNTDILLQHIYKFNIV